MNIVTGVTIMSLKKSKKEITAEIAKSFARYFNDSNNTCRYEWLRNPDEDENLESETENSLETKVHNEAPKNARSSAEITENVQQFNCQNGDQLAAGENANSTGKLLGASETHENVTNVEELRCLNEKPAFADETEKLSPCVIENEEETTEDLIIDFIDNGLQQDDSHNVRQKMCSVDADTNKSNSADRNSDSSARIDDNEAASTVSDQLGRYITLYDQQGKKGSSDEDKEFEYIIGDQQAISMTELTENGLSQQLEVHAPNNLQQMSTRTIGKRCTYESAFDVLQDAQNPMVFHVCPKTPGQPAGRRVMKGHNQQLIFYNGPELKRCSIPLNDFRVRRCKNPLVNMQFFVEKPQKVKRLKKAKHNFWRKPRRTSTANQKKVKTSKRHIVAQIKHENVAQPSSLWNAIQEAYPKPTPQTVAVPPTPVCPTTDGQTFTAEEKAVLINQWLELSSQVQPDNNVDVNEFLQCASLPILSDIEEDAYELSSFLDFHDQSNNQTPNAHTVKLTIPRQFIDEVPLNTVVDLTGNFPQPLDLSTKQTTPTSNDTGFCNGSSSLDARHEYTKVDSNRCGQAAESKSSSSQIHDAAIKLPLNTSTEKHPRVVDSLAELTPEVEATPAVKVVPEVPQRVPFPSDWNIDNYSTDLDYEPSEDEEDDAEVVEDELPDQSYQTESNTLPVDRVFSTESRGKSISEKASSSRDTRVVTRLFSSKSDDSTKLPSATVNVEPQPTITKTNKPEIESKMVPSVPQPISTEKNRPAVESIGSRRLPDDLKKTAGADEIGLLKKQIEYLLNRPCIDYMTFEACTRSCRRNHSLPPAEEVHSKLKLFPTDTILSIYSRFIARNRMTFINYFPTICLIFSARRLRSSLIAAVEHCDQHNKKSFYGEIYRGCVRAGMSKLKSLTEIANVSCKTTISCTYIFNIAVKEDPELFKKMLQDYYPLANIESHHMLTLLGHVADNPVPSLLKLLVDIFDKYSRSDISDIDPYKMIFHEIRSHAVSDAPQLVQRLNSIASRDKRLNSE